MYVSVDVFIYKRHLLSLLSTKIWILKSEVWHFVKLWFNRNSKDRRARSLCKWEIMQKINLCYRESNDYHGQVIDHFVTEIPKQKAKIVSVPQEGSDESLAISTNGILWSFKSFFKNAFLPQNFPHSVSEDYLDYQLWDSIQAFASSISGSLATQVSHLWTF